MFWPWLVTTEGDASGQHQPGERREHAAGDQHAPQHALDPDAGDARGLGIAADRIERTAPAVVAQE